MAYILVVEDEEPISDILRYALEREGYAVECAYDGNEAIAAAKRTEPSLVLLDVMLPEKDGFEVCREIRRFSQVPVIMLTARDAELDKVVGLEIGADDYVTKPFSTRELIARVKANLRRQVFDGLGLEGNRDKIIIGDLTINLNQYEVTRRGEVIPLTRREFELFSHLAARPGVVFTREQLLSDLWGMDYVGDERAVDVTVRRLREKIEVDASRPRYIMTRRGVGYYARR